MIYDSNQRPDVFSYSDRIDDDLCLQPSSFVHPSLKSHLAAKRNRLPIHLRVHSQIREPILRGSSKLPLLSAHRNSILPSFPSNAGFHPHPNLLQRSFSQSHDGATARDRDLARCNARLFNCVNCVSCHRCSPRLFHIQNSKTRFRGTTHIRHIDICLVVIVIMKLVSSILQTAVIWTTLNSSNVHIFKRTF